MKYKPFIVLAYFQECKVPPCLTEYQFHLERKWRFDFAWPEQKVALEVEGGSWMAGRHSRGAGFNADMEKYNAAVLAGWKVLRVTPQTVAMMDTVLMLKRLLKG